MIALIDHEFGQYTMIAVLGSSNCSPSPGSALWHGAEVIGRGLATLGFTVCTGGGAGVAGAAGRAAIEAGGLVVGILPQENFASEPATLDVAATNIRVQTGLPPKARNFILLASCRAAIAIGGGYGTLNEMTIALAHRLPLIVVEGYGGAASLMRQIAATLGGSDTLYFAQDSEAALIKIAELLHEPGIR